MSSVEGSNFGHASRQEGLTLEWALAEILACPACGGRLQYLKSALSCTDCPRVYTIHNGIPQLLDSSVPPQVEAEAAWYEQKPRDLSLAHHLAHAAARSPISDVLRRLGCDGHTLILSVATGDGVEIPYLASVSERIVAVDVAEEALVQFRRRWPYLVFQAEARKLPFRDRTFDAIVVSGFLHHVVGYDSIEPYLREFLRVARPSAVIVAVEPNALYPAQWLLGPINRVGQRIHPGWRGLVPHERPLLPGYVVRKFMESGVTDVDYFSTTYVHNRFPLRVARWLAEREGRFRMTKVLRPFGWWFLVMGRRGDLP